MTRERNGRHEAAPTPITTTHESVQAAARASILAHPGYRGRHRKAVQG